MIAPAAHGQGSALAVLWRHRWLLRSLIGREIQNRYVGSIGGFAWALVHPLVLLGIYSVLFQTVFRVKFPELAHHPFIVFMAAAMWPWLAFAEGLSRGTQAVVANAPLVKKVAFPHELLVYAAVIASFAVYASGYALVLVVLWAIGISLHGWMLPWVLAYMLLLLIMASGLALAFSAVQAFVRDFEQLLGQVLSVLFFLTPILYPISMVPPALQVWMQANPLVHIVEPLRQALLFGAVPGATPLLLSMAGVLLAFAAGRWMFLRLSPYFEDVT